MSGVLYSRDRRLIQPRNRVIKEAKRLKSEMNKLGPAVSIEDDKPSRLIGNGDVTFPSSSSNGLSHAKAASLEKVVCQVVVHNETPAANGTVPNAGGGSKDNVAADDSQVSVSSVAVDVGNDQRVVSPTRRATDIQGKKGSKGTSASLPSSPARGTSSGVKAGSPRDVSAHATAELARRHSTEEFGNGRDSKTGDSRSGATHDVRQTVDGLGQSLPNGRDSHTAVADVHRSTTDLPPEVTARPDKITASKTDSNGTATGAMEGIVNPAYALTP